MIVKYVLILIFSVFISSIAQMLLKISANENHASKLKEYLNFRVIVSYGIFVVSTILTVIAYKGVYLKSGPIIESTGYIFVLILGKMLLKEKITKNKLIGITTIIFGIIVFSL